MAEIAPYTHSPLAASSTPLRTLHSDLSPEASAERTGAVLVAPDSVAKDTFELSPEGLARSLAESNSAAAATVGGATARPKGAANPEPELSADEQKAVSELQNRDREVRAHEQAHKAAGGDLASAPSFEYETGPDGKRYAVAGEVGISLRSGRTPDESASIARRVRSAALAPAQPSAQDLSVAADATKAEQAARKEKAEAEREEGNEPGGSADALSASSAYSESSVAETSGNLLDLLA